MAERPLELPGNVGRHMHAMDYDEKIRELPIVFDTPVQCKDDID